MLTTNRRTTFLQATVVITEFHIRTGDSTVEIIGCTMFRTKIFISIQYTRRPHKTWYHLQVIHPSGHGKDIAICATSNFKARQILLMEVHVYHPWFRPMAIAMSLLSLHWLSFSFPFFFSLSFFRAPMNSVGILNAPAGANWAHLL